MFVDNFDSLYNIQPHSTQQQTLNDTCSYGVRLNTSLMSQNGVCTTIALFSSCKRSQLYLCNTKETLQANLLVINKPILNYLYYPYLPRRYFTERVDLNNQTQTFTLNSEWPTFSIHNLLTPSMLQSIQPTMLRTSIQHG